MRPHSVLRSGRTSGRTVPRLIFALIAAALLLGTAVAQPALEALLGGAADDPLATSTEPARIPHTAGASTDPSRATRGALRDGAGDGGAPSGAVGPILFIAQSILDLIVGLPSMIYQLTTNFNQMVGAFGSILANPGSILEALVQGAIDPVDSFTPTSWKQAYAPCTPSAILNLSVAAFQNPFVPHTDNLRL